MLLAVRERRQLALARSRFVERIDAVAVTLARSDELMLAMTTRLNLMDKRRDELRQEAAAVGRVG